MRQGKSGGLGDLSGKGRPATLARLAATTRWLTFASLTGLACSGSDTASRTTEQAAASALATRLTGPTDDTVRTLLSKTLHPLARVARDVGRADGDRVWHGLSVVFNVTPAAQADLDALLVAQQSRTSPDYHRWLTPEAYADRFGMSPSDLDAVGAWLTSHGLTVERTARSRTRLYFGGTTAQIERAFRTDLHRYVLPSSAGDAHAYTAMSTAPSIPAAFASAVLDIHGVSDLRARPPVHQLTSASPDARDTPDDTFGDGTHGIAPEDFATIYGVDKLYAAGIDGAGAKIAIIGQTYYVPGDIATFRQDVALPPAKIQDVLVPDTGAGGSLADTGSVEEAELDLDWAGAIAKNATVVFVYTGANGGDADDARTYAIDQALAPIVSQSYGLCEGLESAADAASEESLAKQANAQGITVFMSSGDEGAAACDGGMRNETAATQGLAVAFPASVPEVTSVGGTRFNDATGTYWNPLNDAALGSALSYIPEVAWNDTTPGGAIGFASGGGVSTLFSKPSWQTGTGVPADGQRDVPDVALTASGHDGYIVYYSTTSGETTAGVYQNGGTSAAAPSFAAIMTLFDQATNAGGLGNINPMLYELAAATPSPFHDITTGNNIVACAEGSPSCPASPPYQFGYSADVGYDPVTGLGSVDAYALVSAWESTLDPTETTIAPPTGALAPGVPFHLVATVTTASAASKPTGSVAFFSGSVALGTATTTMALAAPGGGYTVTASVKVTLPVGVYPLTARYSGDARHAFSSGATTVTITAGGASSVDGGAVDTSDGGAAADAGDAGDIFGPPAEPASNGGCGVAGARNGGAAWTGLLVGLIALGARARRRRKSC